MAELIDFSRRFKAVKGLITRGHVICRITAAFLILFMLIICPKSVAASGDLDTSFGSSGKATSPIGTGDDYGNSAVLQSDGKIVVAGSSYNGSNHDFSLVRYNGNGSLDTTFGGGGKVTTPIGSGHDYGNCAVMQSDGKIIVAGWRLDGNQFALVRYNTDGGLDTSFGSGGKVSTLVGNGAGAQSVAVQSDGKIIVAGWSSIGSVTGFALVRYNANGSLDTTFGSGGKVTTLFGSGGGGGYSVTLQTDGKILVAGYSGTNPTTVIALARYNANGSLDTSFGTGGKVTTSVGPYGRGHSVALQGDGKIVVAGWAALANTYYDVVLVRYDSSGSLDLGFGNEGKVTTDFSAGGADDGRSVVVQSNGKIIVAGSAGYSDTDFALARYNANGSLDAGFGIGGKVITPIGNSSDDGNSVSLQNDGRIIVAGYSHNGSNWDFAVARYLGDALSIITQPQDQAAVTGSSATFTVGASGFPNPTYQWRFNGANIAGATSFSLTLSNVQLANAGSYSVVVTNPSSQITSTSAKLTVHSNLAPVVSALPTYTSIPPAEPGKDSLVFITHGRTENGPANFDWLDTMKETIKLNVPANWMVLNYKWEENSRHRVTAILGHATKEGANVGRSILDIAELLPGEKWEHIHLIAHSAGSELIEEASRVIKASSPTTIIHTTFLDPYTGATDDRRAFYGQHSDWSDNYFSFSTDTKDHWAFFGRRTFGRLPNSHNVDVTGLDPASGLFAVYLPSESSTPAAPTYVPVSTHGWPYRFYTATVPTNQIPGGQGYGFPLSKEGGGWANRASYPHDNVPVVLGGTSGVDQGAIPLSSNGYLNLTALPYTIGSTGSIQFAGGSFTASTGGTEFAMAQARSIPGAATTTVAPSGAPAWTSIAVELTSAVNYVSFNAEFTSAAGAVGLLSVFWNDQKIGEIDERNVLPGVQSYFFEVDGSYTDRNNTLGFRLDQFSAVISTVSVSNVTTGYGGVSGPMNLAVGKLPANPAPILTLTGLTNYTYLIEASEDLLNWEPMAAVTLDAGVTVSFEDLDAHLFPKRFYRAVSP